MKAMPHSTTCSRCVFKELCQPNATIAVVVERVDAVIKRSRRLKKGDFLFRNGDGFDSLFVVRTGFLKTVIASHDGRDQVTGFFMSGELVGMDGICNQIHYCDAVALEDTEVCELPYASMEELCAAVPELQLHFYRLFSQEIVRDQNVMLLLGNMRAEERLAAFLLNLSQRLKKRGLSANDFILRMSREEIGSYLGLKLETVSRTLSKFSQEGLIEVEYKHIRLLKPERLKQLASGLQPAVV